MRVRRARSCIVSTYNEPLITAEWAVAIFRKRARTGSSPAFVSNGNGTPRVLEYLRPHIDLYKVDLKSFDDRRYRELGGRLQPILDTIAWLHDAGVWVEIVTLLDARVQRQRRRNCRGLTRVPRRRLARHPLARHGVSSGLQDDRSGEHDAGDAAARGAHRAGRGPPLRLRGQSARAGRRARTHALPRAAATRLIARYGYLIQEYAPDTRRRLPALPGSGSRAAGARASRASDCTSVPAARPDAAVGPWNQGIGS